HAETTRTYSLPLHDALPILHRDPFGARRPQDRRGNLMSATTEERTAPRLKLSYREEVRGKLQDEFSYANAMQVPGLVKIVVNMGDRKSTRLNSSHVSISYAV